MALCLFGRYSTISNDINILNTTQFLKLDDISLNKMATVGQSLLSYPVTYNDNNIQWHSRICTGQQDELINLKHSPWSLVPNRAVIIEPSYCLQLQCCGLSLSLSSQYSIQWSVSLSLPTHSQAKPGATGLTEPIKQPFKPHLHSTGMPERHI